MLYYSLYGRFSILYCNNIYGFNILLLIECFLVNITNLNVFFNTLSVVSTLSLYIGSIFGKKINNAGNILSHVNQIT